MSDVIVNRQGKKLSVQMAGPEDAAAILFSNSLGTDRSMWEPQINALKAHYRIVSYDTRGHGTSDVIDGPTLQDLGSDVIDILDGLSIAKAHFCGISMGGLTGLWLGIHHHERFHSLTVGNSAAKIGTQTVWEERANAVASNGLSELVTSTPTRWFSEYFDYKRNALAMRAIQSLADTSPQGYANACRALASADLRENISSIFIPTLIIAGSFDPVTTVADGEFMQTRIPGSKLSQIAASHLSNIEQPEAFNQEIKRFIESVT